MGKGKSERLDLAGWRKSMEQQNPGSDNNANVIEQKATFGLLTDLLIAPAVTIILAARDFSYIYGHLIFSGLFIILAPLVIAARHPFSNKKNVINLYFDLFSGNFLQFSFIHRACLITLVIVDSAGMLLIMAFLYNKFIP